MPVCEFRMASRIANEVCSWHLVNVGDEISCDEIMLEVPISASYFISNSQCSFLEVRTHGFRRYRDSREFSAWLNSCPRQTHYRVMQVGVYYCDVIGKIKSLKYLNVTVSIKFCEVR